jgi:hypothetical protein
MGAVARTLESMMAKHLAVGACLWLLLTGCGTSEHAPAGAPLLDAAVASDAADVQDAADLDGGGGNGPDAGGMDAGYPVTTQSSVSRHGITWTFASSETVGQFANGDYWVLDSGNGVTIASISPSPSGGRHGSMLDPRVDNTQSYDDRLANYDAALGVALPVTITGTKSLVSTESLTTAGPYEQPWAGRTVSEDHVRLKSAAVLTIVASQPPPDALRPSIHDPSKRMVSLGSIHLSELPDLLAPASLTAERMAYLERGLERIWLMHLSGWQARAMHPLDNMLNYHEYIGAFESESALALLTDACTPELLIRYVQNGIDQYYVFTAGTEADSAFFHWPVLMTGLLLDDEPMQSMFIDGTHTTQPRADEKFYYVADGTSVLASNIVPTGQTWTGATVAFRKQLGNTEHEHLHPSEWGPVDNGGGIKQEGYRHCCDSQPHVGQVLAARILGKEELWAHPAAFDYVDRWMTEDFATLHEPVVDQYWGDITSAAQSAGSPFVDDMWAAYR